MRFVTALALAVGLLVLAPYVAHRLRRRRAEERPFAATKLVLPAPPRARRRSKLEDRGLFGVRALAVLALAVLGASPLVRCSRLSLERSSGASVAMAIVVDDSMSMRAKVGSRTRFERAKEGATQLLASAREGDSIAIVLAGASPRVALAATTDLTAARATIEGLRESDRATDLDAAITIADGLVAQLPQIDHRVVVLSDLADGRSDASPLGERSALPLWFPMLELRANQSDCGILGALRTGVRVRVRVACGAERGAEREVTIARADAKDVIARARAPQWPGGEVTLTLPNDDPRELTARLTGEDAIVSDDSAWVVTEAGPGAIAVVGAGVDEFAVTGGAPIVEQALAALRVEMSVRPIPALPDRADDLTAFVGIILDDPPGLTPEERHALESFLDAGGVALLALGPRAAAAPLGASLAPIVSHAIAWEPTPVPGADASSATSLFSESAGGLTNLGSKNRAILTPEDASTFDTLIAWSGGPPLIARRSIGRGSAWIVTLPFSLDASDFTLRPAFLALLDAWVAEARTRAAPRTGEVGAGWTFAGAHELRIDGPNGSLPLMRDGTLLRAIPDIIGAYRIDVDGKKEMRVASAIEREMDLRPRRVAPSTAATGIGADHAAVDVSSSIALVLLALVAIETALRLRAGVRDKV